MDDSNDPISRLIKDLTQAKRARLSTIRWHSTPLTDKAEKLL